MGLNLYFGQITELIEKHNNDIIIANIIIEELRDDEIYDLALERIAHYIELIRRQSTRNAQDKALNSWREEKKRNSYEYRKEYAKRKKEVKKLGFNSITDYEADKFKKLQDAPESEATQFLRLAVNFTQDLLNKTFALGNGVQITWKDATIEQHQQRIEYMQNKMNGYGRDIELHENAIELLVQTKNSTLGELKEKSLLAKL